ncbi:MAG TPA: multicopper oxidase domain-containing protein, partial [Chitinophagaceae bacterium]|nr:multicopper oxidase domain-containing protein [Chitinophagaceae bacterium]
MKKIFLIVLLISAYSFINAQTKVIWTCPMHPQIQRNKAGTCPICGMTLVKKTVKVAAPKKQETEKVPVKDDMKNMDMKKDTTKKMDMPVNEDKMKMDSVEGAIADQIQSKVYILPGKKVRYDLYVKDTIVNFTGKNKRAIAINGSIPAPALIFTEGDTAEIYLHNMLKEETSLHWHGVILPNQADGVPFLTTKKIGPGETHLYKFKVVQNGTYWYHSHSALQEQSGMYGALIFRSREEIQMPMTMSHSLHSSSHDTMMTNNNLFNKEYTVVLSEWTDDKPTQIQRRLRTANDWFAIKKGSVQSYSEAIKEGHFKTKLTNEWKRMKAMDVSDVYYNRFLTNGKPEINTSEFKVGDKVKLKVVNAGASSYFWLGYAGGKITVIGNDGNDMVPVEVDRLIIAPAETYDVVVTIPENMSYEFRATSEDRTGYSSLWLGAGHKMPAPTLPRLKYFEGMKMMNDMMNMNGTMNDMGMRMSNQMMDMNSVMYPEVTGDASESDTTKMDHSQHMNMNESKKDSSSMKMDNMNDMKGMNMSSSSDIVTLSYDMLRSPVKTILPEGPKKTLNFTLTGNMNRYVWTLDNKTVKEADRVLINKDEVLRLVIRNNSMMRHPMHLHGHDFRVVNSQGEYSPLKNVVDITPMETDTIEFAANQSGNWFFHCHILFHMMAGMGRVFTYNNSLVNPELPDAEKAYQMFRKHKDQNMYHLMVRAGIEYNGSDGEAMLSTNRSALKQMWHLGYSPHHGYESETILGRYLGVNQWWFPYIGFDYHYKKEEGDMTKSSDYKNMFGQISNKNDRKTFVIGVEYTLPWLVLADTRIDGNGKLRFQLSREDVPITKCLRFNLMGNTDKEYTVGFR